MEVPILSTQHSVWLTNLSPKPRFRWTHVPVQWIKRRLQEKNGKDYFAKNSLRHWDLGSTGMVSTWISVTRKLEEGHSPDTCRRHSSALVQQGLRSNQWGSALKDWLWWKPWKKQDPEGAAVPSTHGSIQGKIITGQKQNVALTWNLTGIVSACTCEPSFGYQPQDLKGLYWGWGPACFRWEEKHTAQTIFTSFGSTAALQVKYYSYLNGKRMTLKYKYLVYISA